MIRATPDDTTPSLALAEPVLSVHDINETVMYWNEVLGFPNKWTWGDPPNHGGASWGGASVQFSLNGKLADASKGNSIWISVRNLPALYAIHQKRANVVSALEDKPWGTSEYTVEDNNGYYIHFSGRQAAKEIQTKDLLNSIRIVERNQHLLKVRNLMISVGWINANANESPLEEQALQSQLQNAVLIAVAENKEGEAVGVAFLLGDNKHFYYIKDVIVHKQWQHNRIGTHMMNHLMQWLHTNAPKPSTVGLFTGPNLAAFYKQFGFMEACGMYQMVM